MKHTLSTITFETHWDDIAEQVSSAMNLSTERRLRLFNNQIARHIVLIPYISGSLSPSRDACSCLSIYLLSISPETKHLYSHTPTDDSDPFQRLLHLMTYSSGDEKIQRAGIALLIMNMIHGYTRDRDRDRLTGKYNPIVSGVWDSEKICDLMNDYYTPFEELYSHYIPKCDIVDIPWQTKESGALTYGKKVL